MILNNFHVVNIQSILPPLIPKDDKYLRTKSSIILIKIQILKKKQFISQDNVAEIDKAWVCSLLQSTDNMSKKITYRLATVDEVFKT